MQPVGVSQRDAIENAGADGCGDGAEDEGEQEGEAEGDAGRRGHRRVLEPVEHRQPREERRAEERAGYVVRRGGDGAVGEERGELRGELGCLQELRQQRKPGRQHREGRGAFGAERREAEAHFLDGWGTARGDNASKNAGMSSGSLHQFV